MKAISIDVKTAPRTVLLAECEALGIEVAPGTHLSTIRTRLNTYQRQYKEYQKWRRLVWLLVGGDHGMTGRPEPATTEGMVEWVNDILFKLLEADGCIGREASPVNDAKNRRSFTITGRQNNGVVDVEFDDGSRHGYSVQYAAACAFKSVKGILADWESGKSAADE